jgi:hypothetical protein
MRLSIRSGVVVVLLAGLLLMAEATAGVSSAPPPLPNPIAIFMGRQDYQANGKEWTRYRYAIFNLTDYPNEMFAAAPELPPCGTNTKAARTWVEIYEQSGKRLYGFCALGNHDGLNELWFALEKDVLPPSWVYIEFDDRKTNTKYKSNLVETVE